MIPVQHEALGDYIPLLGFLSGDLENVFITKSGDVGIVIKIFSKDVECMDGAYVDYVASSLERSMRVFDERYKIYQYLFRRRRGVICAAVCGNRVVDASTERRHAMLSGLYSVETYFVVLLTGKRQARGIPFSVPKEVQLIKSLVYSLAQQLRSAVESFCASVSEFMPASICGRSDTFRMLQLPLSFGNPRPLGGDCFLWYRVENSDIEGHPSYLKVGDEHAIVMTLKDLPEASRTNMFSSLLGIDGSFFLCSEWQVMAPRTAEKLIKGVRRSEFHSRMSMGSYASQGGKKLEDEAKNKAVDEAGKGLVEMYEGRRLGSFSLTAVAHDSDLERAEKTASEILSAMNLIDFRMYRETWNQIPAFFACVPGNTKFNLRNHLRIFNTSYTDLSFSFGVDQGEETNRHLGREALLMLDTAQRTPYWMNLHDQDIAHSLVVGKTGSGKSFLLSTLAANLQRYDPYTLIFDLGGSFESITRLLGGSYSKMDLSNMRLNPFACEATKENFDFLALFVTVLLEQNGDELTAAQQRDVYEQIENLFVLPPSLRMLRVLASCLSKPLEERLKKWTDGGQFGGVFDNDTDCLSMAKFQCFDFHGLEQYPQVLEPLLLYVFHAADRIVLDPASGTRLKVFFIDEGWIFLKNPRTRAYIVEALKTWRKRNGAVVLSTQSVDELQKSGIIDVILESCGTQIFLANPGADPEVYKDKFKLNEREAQLWCELVPKRQMMIKQSRGTKVVNLTVDRESFWLYANGPYENQRRREAFELYGFEEGLKVLAAEAK